MRHALTLPQGLERREALAAAARELRNIDPGRHGELVMAIAAKIAEAEGRGRGPRTNPATGQQEFAIEEITVTGRRPSRFNIAGPGLFMGGQPNDSLPDGDAFAIRFQNSRAAFLNGLIAQGYKLSADGKTLIGPNGEEVEVEPEIVKADPPVNRPEENWAEQWARENDPKFLIEPPMTLDPGIDLKPEKICTMNDRSELAHALAFKASFDQEYAQLNYRLAGARQDLFLARDEASRADARERVASISGELTMLNIERQRSESIIARLLPKCGPES